MEPTQQNSLPFLDTLVTIEPAHSIQKTHPYISILTLGQQPPHHSKTKCLQHLGTQGQNCFFIPGQNGQGTWTHQNSPQTLPIPLLGPQPVATQVHPSQPAVQQHYQHIQQQQHNTQQQKQSHHCSTIHAQYKWKVQKTMQKERNPGSFQRHQHPQNSIRKPQGQGPKNKSNRDYIPLPMPPHKLPQCIHRRVRQNLRWQS